MKRTLLIGAAAIAAVFSCPAVELSVETLTPNLTRVREVGTDGSCLNRYGVFRDYKPTSVIKTSATKLSLGGAEVTVEKSGKGYRVRFPLTQDELVYGLGDASRAGLQRRPGRYEMWIKNVNSYIPIPMAMTTAGHGFLMNTTWRNVIDVGKEDADAIVCTAGESPIDFYVFTGKGFREMLDAYTELTGRSALLPAFAFGFSYVANQWIDQFDLLQEARTFRDRKLPCDVIGLEPGWMETFYDFKTTKRYDRRRFYMPYWMPKTHKRFFTRALKRMGFKLSLWLCCNYDLTRYEEELIGGTVPPIEEPKKKASVDDDGTFHDDHIEKADAHFDDPRLNVDCGRGPVRGPEGSRPWFEHLEWFVDTGARCFKLDGCQQTDPSDRKWANGRTTEEIHNLFAVIYAKQMAQGYEKHTGERAMVYTSCGYAGFQQYVASWAGDTGGGPKCMVSCLNLAVSGHSNQSCDMEVFGNDGRVYPPGLHFGFFAPWAQQNNWDYHDQPWYGEDSDLDVTRAYANLRYRLFPYLYGAAAEASRTGWPLMRPLFFMYPDRRAYADVTTTYFLGDDLLVTSFADEAVVPPGDWYDFRTGKKITGPATVKLEKTAQWGGGLFVRAGAIIPMWPLKQHLDRGWNDVVELHVWPGASGKTMLYEDNGNDLGYRKGAYAQTEITQTAGVVTVGPRKGTFAGMPSAQPKFEIVKEAVK